MSTGLATEVEEELIVLVKDRPMLWNLSNSGYKDILAKGNAWNFIGKTLNITDKEVQNCWLKLKKQYTAYLRKLKKPTGSGTGKLVTFRHAEIMSFYMDQYRPYKSVASNLVEETVEDEYEEPYFGVNSEVVHQYEVDLAHDQGGEGSNNQVGVGSTDEVGSSDQIGSQHSQVGQDTNLSTPSSQPNTKHVRVVGVDIGKSRKRKLDPMDKELLNVLKDSEQDEKDEYRPFSLSIAPKLRRIADKSKKQAAEAQIKIQQILLDYETE